MSDGKCLRTEIRDGVRSIILTRAREYNTITPDLVEELGAAGDGPWAVHDVDGDLLAVYERHAGRAKPSVVIPR